jgi:PhzF family phenazine biosynthesis protein
MASPQSLRVPFFHISSFTEGGQGNPAGVVLLDGAWPSPPPPDAVYLRAAGELNLSETCFIAPLAGGAAFTTAAEFKLRWFSPTKEVALCGHGTLAAAHALASLGNANPALTFHTLSGPLHVRVSPVTPAGDARAPASTQATMTFPSNPPTPRDASEAPLAALAQALLGAEHAHLLLAWHYSARARKAVLLLAPGAASAAAIAALRPSMEALLGAPQAAGARVEGVSVACASGAGGPPHFFTRYWSPWNGLPGGEDPVNGSSHTLLAPLFAALLGVPQGQELTSRQLSARGGTLHVAEQGPDRVSIRGLATTVCEGSMYIAL